MVRQRRLTAPDRIATVGRRTERVSRYPSPRSTLLSSRRMAGPTFSPIVIHVKLHDLLFHAVATPGEHWRVRRYHMALRCAFWSSIHCKTRDKDVDRDIVASDGCVCGLEEVEVGVDVDGVA